MRRLFEGTQSVPRSTTQESSSVETSPEPEAKVIYTIGFGNKKWETFAQELQDAGIDLVIDVRHREATSRSNCFMPQLDSDKFKTEGIARELDKHGIGYWWWFWLGKTQDTLNMSWQKSLSQYEEWLDNNTSGARDVNILALIIESRFRYNIKVALLSPEASAEKAHRRILAERCVKLFANPVAAEIVHL